MTTRWSIPPDMWAGATVAVLAPGPAMTRELAASVRQHKRIAVRRAFEFAPDADMLVALDGPVGGLDGAFWNDARGFRGLRVCGTEHEDIDALYPGLMYERVTIAQGHVIEIRNSGLAAIRIAAQAGAAKILLLGFSTEDYEAQRGLVGLTAGLAAIIEELRAQGIEIERVDSANRVHWTRPPRRKRLDEKINQVPPI